jgi:hypothetical protein
MSANNQNNYNLSPINAGNPESSNYFNNYFNTTFNVSSNIDAAILSYFDSVTDNRASAKALASAVIYTSKTQGMDPMATLQEFTKLPRGQLDAYLTMFLNVQRIGTSYLGITNQPITNKYVNRAILP